MMAFAGITLAGFATLVPGTSFGQGTVRGGVYNFHTGRIGDCPGLDWQVSVEQGGKTTGMVGWDQMAHAATLVGNLQPDGQFELHAKEVDGPRTAMVTGSAAGNFLTLTIKGTGGPCDGKTVQVPRANTANGAGG